MKRLFIAIASIGLALSSLTAASGDEQFFWKDEKGERKADTESMKSRDGFGVQFLLTRNEDVYKDWNRPETPTIDSAWDVKVNEVVVPILIYANPKRDDAGEYQCDIRGDDH